MKAAILQQLALLPERLAWHVLLTAAALAVGLVVSMPLAALCVKSRRLRGPVLALASVVQTIPSLALLAIMVVLLRAIGFMPALIALILYSVLPILRNTVTGILGVEPAILEAARGVGMTGRQMLMKVQLPLAAPTVIAGIRTAAVWIVGIATLSTPVGQPSLGSHIFEGLQLRNNAAVLVGVAAAAGLALVIDGLIRALELASQRRSKVLGAFAGGALLSGLALAQLPLLRSQEGVTVGSKTFTEQYILAELVGQQLQAHGYPVRARQGMGSSLLFDALASSSIDCYIDYSGTIWANVMKRGEALSPDDTLREVSAYLKEKHGIVCVGPLGFENTYALAMPRKQAEKLGIRNIAQLAAVAPNLRLGGDYEFFGRPEWAKVRDRYSLRFAGTVGLDSSLLYAAVEAGQVDVVAAFSTDGRLPAYDMVVLEDPEHAFPPYQAILLVSPRAAAERGLIPSLKPLVGSISDDAMREANRLVDVEGRSPAQACELLRSRLRSGPGVQKQ